MAGYAELVAARTPGADQVIVWVPSSTGLLRSLAAGSLYKETQDAIAGLLEFVLRCYGDDCALSSGSTQHVQGLVSEFGQRPERWRLQCPTCGGAVGPDLQPVTTDLIITRWRQVGSPILDPPTASAAFRSATPISDLPNWIQRSDPSHLELAYLGQQMWPSAAAMMKYLASVA
jgi:hypothetical protein